MNIKQSISYVLAELLAQDAKDTAFNCQRKLNETSVLPQLGEIGIVNFNDLFSLNFNWFIFKKK